MFTLQSEKFRWFGNAEMFTYYANKRLRMNFNCENKKIYVYDGETEALLNTVTVGDNSFQNQSNKQLSLFGQNDGTKTGKYRVHALKITQDGQLVRDYLPMVRLADMQAGLYDRVSGDFHTASGLKVAFSVPQITDSSANADTFRPTAWIESTGAQIINTGIVPGADTSLDIDFTTREYLQEGTLFATMDWNQHAYMLTLRKDRGANEFCWFGDYKFAAFNANRHMRLTVDSANGALTFFDGDTAEQLAQIVSTDFSCKCGKPLSIFGQNDGSKAGKYRIHSFKITQGGTLVRDLVPGYSLVEKRYGFYDQVSKTFFGADGFLSGPVKAYTSTATPGTLGFNVPAGMSYDPGIIIFSGNLAVEKRGAGAFRFSTSNSYTGMTVINEGVVSCTSGATPFPFGFMGNRISIGEAGTFDLCGRGSFQSYFFTVAGGKIANSGAKILSSTPILKSISLTADTEFDLSTNWGMIGADNDETRIDLGGNTLTLTIGDGAYFYLFNTVISNGKLVLKGLGAAWVGGVVDLEAEDVEIVHNCGGLPLAHDIRVRDFTDNSQNVVGVGDGVIRVSGRYCASTDAYRACVIGDGAAINLSVRETPLPVESSATGLAGQTMSFADDATIMLDIGQRHIAGTIRVIGWDSAPANLSTLKFNVTTARPLMKYRAVVKTDGIYIDNSSTLIVIR